MPARNEEGCIGTTLQRFTEVLGLSGIPYEIVVVDDGIADATGDAVAIVMADGSDSPEDAIQYYRKLQEGYDCVFGSRFIRGGRVIDYPRHKLILNRMANAFIRILF